jgi:hypothetical protein
VVFIVKHTIEDIGPFVHIIGAQQGSGTTGDFW